MSETEREWADEVVTVVEAEGDKLPPMSESGVWRELFRRMYRYSDTCTADDDEGAIGGNY